ncbi:hypothetical protein [Lysinibacillus xylanilyticus]|uniref:Uncharacterized protein n=1 Tax=Lysinibacillus xylanilyticus TaxID=582475 RepID=A0A2M9PW71_9BACI|nr:hypothetical protein [Lysinibacillus xylanilyticus]PJO40081.1 hypothetical protein CWD94_30075 [Lysinibacillus xylanilyticus]
MRYKFEYKTMEERESIIYSNTGKRLVEEHNITEGNFLVFDDDVEMLVVPQERLETLETSQADQDELLMQLMLQLEGN